MRYKVTIASGALDENPDVQEFDRFEEAQDHIFMESLDRLGTDHSEEEFEEFMTLVRLEEINE